MSQTLRDQLMGLGFKPEPVPERPKPEKVRTGHSRNDAPAGGNARHGSPGDASRGSRARATDDATRGQRRQEGTRRNQTPRAGRHRAGGGGEMDLAKAYAIRSQTEKNERIAAEKERQEQAQRRREGKLKLAELLKTAALNDKDAEIARHFEYGGKIRRVYVTAGQLRQVNVGELGVVQHGGRFFIVTPEHAHAAEALLTGARALLVDPNVESTDDQYADPQYQVPDDLVW